MELRPNQLASVRIRDVTLEKATVLDPRYIMEDAEGRSYVYIANTDEEIARVKKVYVERLISGANEVLVEDTEYLENGVRIIDQGARLIVADQRVRMRSNT